MNGTFTLDLTQGGLSTDQGHLICATAIAMALLCASSIFATCSDLILVIFKRRCFMSEERIALFILWEFQFTRCHLLQVLRGSRIVFSSRSISMLSSLTSLIFSEDAITHDRSSYLSARKIKRDNHKINNEITN